MTNTTKNLKDLSKNVRIINRKGIASLPWDKRDDWQKSAHDWRLTLIYQGRRYSLDFWQGSAITEAPTVEGVLGCLLYDANSAEEDFESWCLSLGYDEDSRKVERMYRACIKTSKRLRKLLGADYELFLNAERN